MAETPLLSPAEWNAPVPVARIARAWREGLAQGLFAQNTTAVLFHDLKRLRARLETLQRLFPPNTLHALAIKANPLVNVLREAVTIGAGLEAASLEEIWLAGAAGCPPQRIVFDSPAKTLEELREALVLGVCINADNPAELERIDALLREVSTTSRIGLRVNPLVGEGSIGITSVGGRRSKFGVPIDDGESVLALYGRYPWLNGIHVHVGSQGVPLEHLVAAARTALDLSRRIRERTGRIIEFLDLGGGLPARYVASATPPTPHELVDGLARQVPELFKFEGTIITEFGRAVQASCGWAVTRVEYVKPVNGVDCAVLHLGADFLMRPVYRPTDWPHEFFVLDANGEPKSGPTQTFKLAGPLCFAGDIIAEAVSLPAIEPGDLVVVADAGAYTLSLWSRHCNRAIPQVVGVRDEAATKLVTLKPRETSEDIVRLWS